mmetsp:Transcript_19306/g.41719  ORF Transcript_19306/g.41719 Transcript_19306/m.41719 type:complete len:305 (+) Transcript_19306:1539-2453(+)
MGPSCTSTGTLASASPNWAFIPSYLGRIPSYLGPHTVVCQPGTLQHTPYSTRILLPCNPDNTTSAHRRSCHQLLLLLPVHHIQHQQPFAGLHTWAPHLMSWHSRCDPVLQHPSSGLSSKHTNQGNCLPHTSTSLRPPRSLGAAAQQARGGGAQQLCLPLHSQPTLHQHPATSIPCSSILDCSCWPAPGSALLVLAAASLLPAPAVGVEAVLAALLAVLPVLPKAAAIATVPHHHAGVCAIGGHAIAVLPVLPVLAVTCLHAVATHAVALLAILVIAAATGGVAPATSTTTPATPTTCRAAHHRP